MNDEERGKLYEFCRAQLAVVAIADHVDSLLAAERAAVVAAMLEYLPADSHEKITADVLRKLGEK